MQPSESKGVWIAPCTRLKQGTERQGKDHYLGLNSLLFLCMNSGSIDQRFKTSKQDALWLPDPFKITTFPKFYSSFWWGAPICAQGLVLALCFGTIHGMAQESIWDATDATDATQVSYKKGRTLNSILQFWPLVLFIFYWFLALLLGYWLCLQFSTSTRFSFYLK